MRPRNTPDADRRMALAREWDQLVDQVRGLPGFADFLRPPRLETLLPAAAGGPVVILNVSRWRCDALIVRTSGVEVVELRHLTSEGVAAQAQAYLTAVGARQRATERGEGRRDLAPAGDEARVEGPLDDCLRWMWEAFARELLDHLGHAAPPVPGEPWPRVWWCPTGLLTLLPIHAAGDHRTPGAAVLDRVVSSYTPTLRALREARQHTAGSGRMLFVGMPATPGQADLPNVRVEEELIGHHFTETPTRLVGRQATRDAVLRALSEHDWVHFACHGEQNLADPSRGGLLLHDGPLTVTDLGSRQYRGEFAYLSGCKTAVGGRRLPDEAITLAAALHYTGYRHVIATLWSVWDEQAAEIARDVYTALVRDGVPDARPAARALHHAVRRLRTAHPDRPSMWTPFAHTGP
ncbi:CHAT domain-containing protein [Actinoplanes subtropicus]|uniref:CHAT domain-containing protein n=1 Tax=Actinoplanes subtropicus TaxID=543632 RepID=UPI000A010FBD|nr:CHAT domain-containing protein [Actinoplanes subtropicus]